MKIFEIFSRKFYNSTYCYLWSICSFFLEVQVSEFLSGITTILMKRIHVNCKSLSPKSKCTCWDSDIKWVEICLGPGEGVGWLPLRTRFLTTSWRESPVTLTPPSSSGTLRLSTSLSSSCRRSSLDLWDTGNDRLCCRVSN